MMKTMEFRPNRRGDSLAVALTNSLFAIVLAIVIALILAGAHAQSPQDLERTSAQEAVRNRLHRQGLALWLCGHKRIQLFPGATNIVDRAVLLKNLSGKGLS